MTTSGPDRRESPIVRQNVLRTPGEFRASRPDLRSSERVALAERLEPWVLRPYDGLELADVF